VGLEDGRSVNRSFRSLFDDAFALGLGFRFLYKTCPGVNVTEREVDRLSTEANARGIRLGRVLEQISKKVDRMESSPSQGLTQSSLNVPESHFLSDAVAVPVGHQIRGSCQSNRRRRSRLTARRQPCSG
jgi:hypothetical protein